MHRALRWRGLTGEARRIAEAARRLTPQERDILALWWQQSFALPIPPNLPLGAAFGITAMSGDARHIGGYTLASRADLTFPSAAYVWSCEQPG